MMNFIDKYIIAINLIGFIAFLVNTALYRFTAEKQIDVIITIICVLGGTIGIFFAVVLFDRKAEKRNMMSRVFLLCLLIIEIIVFLYIKGIRVASITELLSSENGIRYLIIYIIGINIITFFAFLIDKINAIEKRTRIRIVTLLGLSFCGGSVGAII
jgi:uncharacterized membrane protein YsdA (DUF1294 family)